MITPEITLAGFNLDSEIVRESFNLLRRLQQYLKTCSEELFTSEKDTGNPPTGHKVQSAGKTLLKELSGFLDSIEPTPESISAAYARISRSPEAVGILRKIARKEVGRARKSNRLIVFKMGHFSVAEHAVLNFDITGISRLGTEKLEAVRLASFTEKSQRYINIQKEPSVPREIEVFYGGEFRNHFIANVHELHKFYIYSAQIILEALMPAILSGTSDSVRSIINDFQKSSSNDWSELRRSLKNSGFNRDEARHLVTLLRDITGKAREDARYVLSLATPTQLGMTANARSIEHTARRLAADSLEEVRFLGEQLRKTASTIVPSLTILADSETFMKETGQPLEDSWFRNKERFITNAARKVVASGSSYLELVSSTGTWKKSFESKGDVTLVAWTANPDIKIASALIQSGAGVDHEKAELLATWLDNNNQLGSFFSDCLKDLGMHDPLPREFEEISFTFEAVMSASCFAQFKRHRMMTLLPQSYDPGEGCTIPETIMTAGLKDDFLNMMEKSSEAFSRVAPHIGENAAAYFLTNAHRRRIRVTLNARELYHISRLRMDSHAQWDIRTIVSDMVTLAATKAPITLSLACGKDQFPQMKKYFYKTYNRTD